MYLSRTLPQVPDLLLIEALDALDAHVAVLDAGGRILHVNQAWARFSLDNGLAGTGLGTNYFDMCGASAATVAAGLRAVLDGTSPDFRHDYPCHGPQAKRWFQMRAERFEHDGQRYLVVAHENITEVKLIQEELDQMLRTDAATGLPNGFAFAELVQDAEDGCAGPVMLLQLQGLRDLDGTFGTGMSHSALRMAAARLMAFAQVGIVARAGDDSLWLWLDRSCRSAVPDLAVRSFAAIRRQVGIEFA